MAFRVNATGKCVACATDTHVMLGGEWVCDVHVDPTAVVQHVDSPRVCKHCGAPTANRVYCSRACRVHDLYPNRDTRRAEVLARRECGETFKQIADALGMSPARAAKIYNDYGGQV